MFFYNINKSTFLNANRVVSSAVEHRIAKIFAADIRWSRVRSTYHPSFLLLFTKEIILIWMVTGLISKV